MPRSSTASDRVYVLKPLPCRLRGVCWLGIHAVAAAGVAASGLPGPLRLVLVAAVLGLACLRRPEPAPLLLVTDSGRWSVPDRGLYARGAGPRTAYTALWVRLVLGHGPRAPAAVLLRPEYRPRAWRRIRLALRAPAPATAARAPGTTD